MLTVVQEGSQAKETGSSLLDEIVRDGARQMLAAALQAEGDPQVLIIAPAAQGCIFCAIVARQAEASVVFEDETVVVFMDLNPVTPGHLLVVPREHAVGLEDLDGATSAHVWSVGHDMSRALRRSGMRCEGINVFLCDGEVAFQTVFHFHLHVIPRYAGDGWTIIPESAERERSLLDSDAQAIKDAIASTD